MFVATLSVGAIMGSGRKPKPESTKGLQIHTAARVPFFDIPVYRLSKEDYHAEFEKFLRKHEAGFDPQSAVLLERQKQDDPAHERCRRERLLDGFGGPWQFNEIVGYVRLHFLGSQVRGALWMVNKTRLVKTRKKQLCFRTDKVAPELDIPLHATNENIFQTIMRYVERAKAELRPRFLDTSVLERIGGFVNWKAMRAA